MKQIISVIGCGWLGMPLASTFIQSGFLVKGSTTHKQKLSLLKTHSIEPHLFKLNDGKTPSLKRKLFNADILILNIPPSGNQVELKHNYVNPMFELFEYIKAENNAKIIFVSSTSVYENQYSLIDESTPRNSSSNNGKALIEIEEWILDQYQKNTTILRFGGLYGANRHPVHFLSGRVDIANPQHAVNLIHLYDCLKIIHEIIKQDKFGYQFNAVANSHPTKADYYTKVAEKLGIDPPQFQPPYDPIDKGKIISNQHLTKTLNYSFEYSNVLDGITD